MCYRALNVIYHPRMCVTLLLQLRSYKQAPCEKPECVEGGVTQWSFCMAGIAPLKQRWWWSELK